MKKYLRRFTHHSDYESYMGGGEALLPNVSVCDDDAADTVHYNPIVEPSIPSNEIWYTTTTNETIDPSEYYEGVAMVSNTYDGQKCVMRFDGDIIDITELFDNDGREEEDTQLLTVQIPETVEIIGEYAFYHCNSLSSITIPSSVTSIGNRAFFDCSGLTSVTIPNSVTSIGDRAFSGCSGLTSVTIPNGVTSIGVSAFYGCSNVTELIYAKGCETVLRTYLTNITSVTIPSSVMSIEIEAFYDCKDLTSITIPNSVTSIGDFAFFGCIGLTTMTIEATTPPTLVNTNAISTATTAIYVPSESVDAYKSASNWSEFSDIIQPIP